MGASLEDLQRLVGELSALGDCRAKASQRSTPGIVQFRCVRPFTHRITAIAHPAIVFLRFGEKVEVDARELMRCSCVSQFNCCRLADICA